VRPSGLGRWPVRGSRSRFWMKSALDFVACRFPSCFSFRQTVYSFASHRGDQLVHFDERALRKPKARDWGVPSGRLFNQAKSASSVAPPFANPKSRVRARAVTQEHLARAITVALKHRLPSPVMLSLLPGVLAAKDMLLIWSDPVNARTAVGGFLFFEDRASSSRGRVGDD